MKQSWLFIALAPTRFSDLTTICWKSPIPILCHNVFDWHFGSISIFEFLKTFSDDQIPVAEFFCRAENETCIVLIGSQSPWDRRITNGQKLYCCQWRKKRRGHGAMPPFGPTLKFFTGDFISKGAFFCHFPVRTVKLDGFYARKQLCFQRILAIAILSVRPSGASGKIGPS